MQKEFCKSIFSLAYNTQIIKKHANIGAVLEATVDFVSVMTLDIDFVPVRLWLKLHISQMLDIDSMSVQL